MAQIIQAIKDAKEKVVGLKQTLRAVQQDKVSIVYLANDVEDHLIQKIVDSCQERQISIVPTNINQKELGRLCQIEVGASVVALIKQ